MFNNHETIGTALDSVLSQSYPHTEVIVVDGMSTDGTRAVLEDYSKRLDIYVSEPDDGIYDALNKGIGLASGDVNDEKSDASMSGAMSASASAGWKPPKVRARYRWVKERVPRATIAA